jgi:hypothetical protein
MHIYIFTCPRSDDSRSFNSGKQKQWQGVLDKQALSMYRTRIDLPMDVRFTHLQNRRL